MNKRLISSELRRGFTGYGFWLALLIGCAIAVWHGCCMEGAPVGFSHVGDVIYWNEKMMFPPNNVAKSLMGMTLDGQASVFMTVMPILAALPMAASLSADMRSGYIKSVLTRTTAKSYYIAKFIAVAATAAVVVTVPFLLDFFLVAMKVPYFQPYAYGGEIVLSGSFSLWGKLYFTCFPLYFVLAVLLVAVYGIIFASFGLLFSFYIENRFLVLIAPFIIWMAITTIFSFLTFPELMGANPFYFLMLAHPAGGSHHQAVSVLISTIVYAALGIGGYFMAGRKRDIF